jgi:hypothetical protein
MTAGPASARPDPQARPASVGDGDFDGKDVDRCPDGQEKTQFLNT